MPDPNTKRPKTGNTPSYEQARVNRILELSKQWGVPTNQIYSTVTRGPKNIYTGYVPTVATQYYTVGANPYSITDRYEDSVTGYSGSAFNTAGPLPITAQHKPGSPVATMNYGGHMGTIAHRSPLDTAMMYANGGTMFHHGSAFPDDTPIYTHNYSNGQLGIGGIPPKVYDDGGRVRRRPGEDYVVGAKSIRTPNPDSNSNQIRRFKQNNFDDGSMFIDDAPNYNVDFPPKVYNFGGGMKAYNTAFSANPFPKDERYAAAYNRNSYAHTFEMGGPITYNPVSFLDNGSSMFDSYENGGGLSRSQDYGSKKKPYPSVKKGDFAGGGRSYPIPTRADAIDALRLAGLHGREDVKAKVYRKYPGLKKGQYGLELEGNLEPIRGVQAPQFEVDDSLMNTPNSVQDYMSAPQQSTGKRGRSGGGFETSFTLGTFGPIMAASALSGQISRQQDSAKYSATEKRRNITQGPYYDPYAYGSGGSSFYKNGGVVNNSRNMTLAQAMDVIRNHGYDIQIEE